MSRKPYPSDLTDAQWEELPDTKRGPPRTTDLREVVNGILYVLRGGGAPDATVGHGVVVLPQVAGMAPGNRSCGPGFGSAAIIDSQSVKTTEKGGRVVTTLANG